MTIARGEQIAAWVRAARGGDRAAFGCLVRQFQDAVAAVALARAGPSAETAVVIGPPDPAGQRMAHVCLRRGTDEAWFDANPIDAVAAAVVMSPVPPVWICEG